MLPSKMKNVVDGSLFLGDDPSSNVQRFFRINLRVLWYKVKRNKIVVGAILISLFLSLTLLFVAIYFATSSGEQLNIKARPVKYPLYAYAKCQIILADDCLCHHNDHLNNLLGHNDSKNEHIHGWMIDVDHGQHDPYVWGKENWAKEGNYYERCGSGKKWFGWKTSYQVGSINTTLSGCGNATLDFGNCNEGGRVVAYKNGKELGHVYGLENMTIAFEFFDGDLIEISGYDSGSDYNYGDYGYDYGSGNSLSPKKKREINSLITSLDTVWKSSQKRDNGYDYGDYGYDYGIILLNNFVQEPCPGK